MAKFRHIWSRCVGLTQKQLSKWKTVNVLIIVSGHQCDQIGQFIALWTIVATLILPNLPTFLCNFYKGFKTFIFLGKSFWATFIDIWWLFTGHTASGHNQMAYQWQQPLTVKTSFQLSVCFLPSDCIRFWNQ